MIRTCQRCGREITELVSFCPFCGAKLDSPDEPAPLTRRLFAFLLDLVALPFAWFVLMLAVALVLGVVAGVSGVSDSGLDRWMDTLFSPVPAVVSFLVAQVLYEWCFESIGSHATLGKLVLRLRVVGADGRDVGPRRVFVRALVRLFVPGALAALTSRRKQALHDVVAGTVVLPRAQASPWLSAPVDEEVTTRLAAEPTED